MALHGRCFSLPEAPPSLPGGTASAAGAHGASGGAGSAAAVGGVDGLATSASMGASALKALLDRIFQALEIEVETGSPTPSLLRHASEQIIVCMFNSSNR